MPIPDTPARRPLRIALVAIGSTGDVQPMVVLGKTLRRRGHHVTLAAFETFQPLVENAGLFFRSLPVDADTYIGTLIRPGANPLTYLQRFERALRDVSWPMFEGIYGACHEKDVIVSTFFGSIPYAIAYKLNTPLVQTNYCLTDLTGEHCLPIMKQLPLGSAANRLTYRLAYQMIGGLEARYFTPWCKANAVEARNSRRGVDSKIGKYTVPILYAFSEHVVPRPAEWPENIRITGFLEDAPEVYTPSPALAAFLGQSPAPLFIGFGSMTSGNMQNALAVTLSALKQTGLRAVLAAHGWGDVDAAQLPQNVHMLREYVPHRWLFERVSAIVHHGGAGTTAAALHAGKPALVIPFGSDQYFWGDRVHALQCGPKPFARTRLTSSRLAASLYDLVTTQAYHSNAAALQSLLQAENGAANAARQIEEAAYAGIFPHGCLEPPE